MKILIKSAFVLCLIFLGAHAAFAACGDSITGGTGTSVDPYQINTPTELAAVSNCLGNGNSGKYFKVMNDIDLDIAPYNTGDGWQPIGSSASPFYGRFTGGNFTISNLYINRPSTSGIGLFGAVGPGALVQRIYLTNVSIDGGSSDIGALAGYSEGTIRNVGVSGGTVTGLMRIGGVVGSVRDGGNLQRAYSSGITITQKAAGSECCVGGITGATEFDGSTSNSYSRSNIVHTSGGQGVFGGGIGSTYLGTSVSNLYSTGTITTLSSYPVQVGGLIGNFGTAAANSYWDTQTSSWPTSGSGAGKTTTEMKTQGTFSGWDFSSVWDINGGTNNGYPFLRLSVPDMTASTALTLSPADDSLTASLSNNLVVTFDEVVIKGSGNITIYKSADDSVVETINIESEQVTGDGSSVITINPSSDLEPNTSYYIQITPGGFIDEDDNSFAGITTTSTWNFTTGNYQIPTVVYPVNNQRMNAFYIDMTIHEPVFMGSLKITFTGATTYVVTLNDLAVGQHIITIPFNNPLLATEVASSTPGGAIVDGTYTVTLSHRDITNTTNLSTAPISIVVDTAAPIVTTLSPADNATGINLNPDLIMTFNESVIKHSGTVTLYKTSDDSVVETIDVISSAIDGNETTQMTIRPSVNLLANTDYYIRADAGVFRDLAGNNYAGISNSTTWNFTTGDYTAPILTTVTPIASFTTIANARYVFRTSAACEPLAETPESSLTGESLETIITPPVPGTDLIALISGIQVGGTYSVRFQCVDSDFNSSNIVTVGPFTVVAPPATDSQNTIVTSGYLAPKRQTGIIGTTGGSPTGFARTLKMNMRGSDVLELQKWLNKNGFIVTLTGAGSLGKESDLFGLMTKKAVMKFQISKNLKADGIVGPKTAAFMTVN